MAYSSLLYQADKLIRVRDLCLSFTTYNRNTSSGTHDCRNMNGNIPRIYGYDSAVTIPGVFYFRDYQIICIDPEQGVTINYVLYDSKDGTTQLYSQGSKTFGAGSTSWWYTYFYQGNYYWTQLTFVPKLLSSITDRS